MSFIRPEAEVWRAVENVLAEVRTVQRFFCLWEGILVEVEHKLDGHDADGIVVNVQGEMKNK